MAILLIPVAIAVNMVAGQVAAVLRLPIFLDTIGTILIATIAGPWVGVATGGLSNLLNGVIDPGFLPFTPVSMVTGLVVGFLSKRSFLTTTPKLIISSIIVSLSTSIIAAPIVTIVFGGVTGSGSTFITAFFLSTGHNLIQSVFTAQIIAELADKLISLFISYGIVKAIPSRYLVKFSCGYLYIPTTNK